MSDFLEFEPPIAKTVRAVLSRLTDEVIGAGQAQYLLNEAIQADMATIEDQNQQQAETIKQLQARVGRLESQIIEVLAYKGVLTEKQVKSLELALGESSQQSTAAIQAEAFDHAEVQNCMKAECISEEVFYLEMPCHECAINGDDEDCETCEGTGSFMQEFTVPWDSMKSIWKMMNKSYANYLRQQADKG